MVSLDRNSSAGHEGVDAWRGSCAIEGLVPERNEKPDADVVAFVIGGLFGTCGPVLHREMGAVDLHLDVESELVELQLGVDAAPADVRALVLRMVAEVPDEVVVQVPVDGSLVGRRVEQVLVEVGLRRR